MIVNIYYGGRGLIEDPTIYVMNKITEVLQEIRVEVKRYNLYEDKNGISVLPKTLKEADAIILAVNVEWMGIGGLMHQFLEACWLYGDKKKISNLYMMPVVIATTAGEREAEFELIRAWELLGGILVDGICAYIADNVDFETSAAYALKLEKSAEMLYRFISQKSIAFPNSTNAVKNAVIRSNSIELTPQESEQLSMYNSSETYVKKQKEDLEELTHMFKGMLGDTTEEKKYIKDLKKHFKPIDDLSAVYEIEFIDINCTIVVEVKKDKLNCYYGSVENPDVLAKTKASIMDQIVCGEKTFQSAFMSGELTAQGNFKILRTFDTVFRFQE